MRPFFQSAIGLMLATVVSHAAAAVPVLPVPAPSPRIAKHLSLKEAVLLALRQNPEIQNNQLDRVSEKFALEVAHNDFWPQYRLTGDAIFSQNKKPTYTATPEISLKTGLGTQLSARYAGSSEGGENNIASFSATQPLLRGFGPAVTQAALYNTIDQEHINQLSQKATYMSTISRVIRAYHQVVQNENGIIVQHRQLTTAAKLLEQDTLRIKAGQMAQSELIQQESNVSRQKLSYADTQNALKQSYQSLFVLLGIDPNSQVSIDKEIAFKTDQLPSYQAALRIALENNVAYQQALKTLRINKRQQLVAEDNKRWKLDATSKLTLPNGRSPSEKSVTFNLSIPIHDLSLDQRIVSARIIVARQKILINTLKRNISTTIINTLRTLASQLKRIQLGETTIDLDRKNLHTTILKQNQGMATSFQQTTEQNTLIADELNLINLKISHLDTLAGFREFLGLTLSDWQITLTGNDEASQ